jgi:hypothetical protein
MVVCRWHSALANVDELNEAATDMHRGDGRDAALSSWPGGASIIAGERISTVENHK